MKNQTQSEIAQMSAELLKQDETLPAALLEFEACFASIVETPLTEFEAEMVSEHISQDEIVSMRQNVLAIMSAIHNDITDKLNEMREGTLKGFFSESDKYIPAQKNNNFAVLFANI